MQLNTLGVVHEFLRRHVKEGAFCIDATAGRGRDTALLCRLAGERGRVLSFDIQQSAVDQTKALLEQEGLSAQVILDSHAHMERYAQAEMVDCVVFNFGRLPGGDPHIFTRAGPPWQPSGRDCGFCGPAASWPLPCTMERKTAMRNGMPFWSI